MKTALEIYQTTFELVAWMLTPLVWLCAAIVAVIFLLGGICLSLAFGALLVVAGWQNKAYQIAYGKGKS